MTAYLPIFFSWLFFGLVHSLTAANGVKERVVRTFPALERYYRLAYNVLALLTFLPVVAALQGAPSHLVVGHWAGSPWLGMLLLIAGLSTVLWALKQYDMAEFTGWPPAKLSGRVGTLQQEGLLHYVRHPLYSGILIGLAGLIVYQPDWKHLIFSLAAFVYIRIGIHFEERKLIRTFGDVYTHYRQRVPMLIPGFRNP